MNWTNSSYFKGGSGGALGRNVFVNIAVLDVLIYLGPAKESMRTEHKPKISYIYLVHIGTVLLEVVLKNLNIIICQCKGRVPKLKSTKLWSLTIPRSSPGFLQLEM